MERLLGKPIAERLLVEIGQRMRSSGVVPGLGVVLVGNDPASELYVSIKQRRAEELGFRFDLKRLSETASEDEILSVVRELNQDAGLHGIVVQLPLPVGINADRIIAAIDPEKDADGFHPDTMEKFFLGDDSVTPVFPQALIELARQAGAAPDGRIALGVVRSDYFRRVLVQALSGAGYRPRVFLQGESSEWRPLVPKVDYLFTACGTPGLFSLAETKSGAVVIDGGVAERDGKMFGDVDPVGHEGKPGWFSPVPGGVGPVTVACLLARVCELSVRYGKKKALSVPRERLELS